MIVKKALGIDVVQAAKKRIIDMFDYAQQSGQKVQLCFSGGKDSIVLADIIYNLCISEQIDKSRLIVLFIDEEAMFDDVIDITKMWRHKFMEIGVRFEWYCLQVKHFNCLNSMTDEETFVCWDEAKKDVWVRERPNFAITDDEFLIPYKDNYQSFLQRYCKAHKYISVRGVRVSESIQRQKNTANMKTKDIVLPIYDFQDSDIWMYIYRHNLEYPKTYENLWRIGCSKKELRISQFFSIDTAKVLVNLGEMYPDLMERVTKREPNAYLCAMYWDTEMFGRNTRKRKQLEKKSESKDYKSLVANYLNNPELCPHPELTKYIRNAILRSTTLLLDKDWKRMYECIIKGDPKHRTIRGIMSDISSRRKDLML